MTHSVPTPTLPENSDVRPGCTPDETGYRMPQAMPRTLWPDDPMPTSNVQDSAAPGMNTGMTFDMNSDMNTGMGPDMNAGMSVSMNPGINSDMNASINTGMNPDMNPSMNVSMNPGINPAMNASPVETWAAPPMTQSQRMKNPVDMESTHNPADSRDAYLASQRSLLNRNIGYFVVATFLIGTGQTVTWQGILHTVGSDYMVLYQPDYERYISCDLYSLKFMQFHNTRDVPYCAGSQCWLGRMG